MTRTFVESLDGQLQLFFLPGYSPDLNPDELVWNNLKNQGTGKRAITGPDQLKKLVVGHLRYMQKTPELVQSFNRTPSTEYAAQVATIMRRLVSAQSTQNTVAPAVQGIGHGLDVRVDCLSDSP